MNDTNTETAMKGNTCFDRIYIQEYGMTRGISSAIFFAFLIVILILGFRRKLKNQICYRFQLLCIIFSFLSFFSGLLIVTMEAKSNLILLESLQGQALDVIAYQSIVSLVANLFYPVLVACVGFVFALILYQKKPNEVAPLDQLSAPRKAGK